jgi:hypothetical protein
MSRCADRRWRCRPVIDELPTSGGYAVTPLTWHLVDRGVEDVACGGTAFVWLTTRMGHLVYPDVVESSCVEIAVCAHAWSPAIWLVVDDNRPCPEGWTGAATAAEAIDLLATGRVTHVAVGRDIGSSEAGAGYVVLSWLKEKASTDLSFAMPVVSLHTANPAARLKMALTLNAIRRARQP